MRLCTQRCHLYLYLGAPVSRSAYLGQYLGAPVYSSAYLVLYLYASIPSSVTCVCTYAPLYPDLHTWAST